jgi:hypothetical protein
MKGLARITLVGWVTAGVLMSLPALAAGQNDQEQQAVAAAKAWLALVDSGSYAESWDAAAPVFQAAVTKEGWEDSLNQVRKPLGALESRELASAEFMTDPPNAPKGEYVVIRFQTSFENLEAAIETVVPMRTADGIWKLSGYFIAPQ